VCAPLGCHVWKESHSLRRTEDGCYLIYEVERVKIVHCGVFTRGMDKAGTYLALHARFPIFPHFPVPFFCFVSLAQQKTV